MKPVFIEYVHWEAKARESYKEVESKFHQTIHGSEERINEILQMKPEYDNGTYIPSFFIFSKHSISVLSKCILIFSFSDFSLSIWSKRLWYSFNSNLTSHIQNFLEK